MRHEHRPRLPISGSPVYLPLDMPLHEQRDVVLLLQACLLIDAGEAKWHSRWENYTCSLRDVEGGTQ